MPGATSPLRSRSWRLRRPPRRPRRRRRAVRHRVAGPHGRCAPCASAWAGSPCWSVTSSPCGRLHRRLRQRARSRARLGYSADLRGSGCARGVRRRRAHRRPPRPPRRTPAPPPARFAFAVLGYGGGRRFDVLVLRLDSPPPRRCCRLRGRLRPRAARRRLVAGSARRSRGRFDAYAPARRGRSRRPAAPSPFHRR